MSSLSAVNTLLGSTTSSTNSAIDVSTILAGAAGATTPAIDVTAAVAAAIYAARAPERIWQADQATLTSQTSGLTAMQTATTALTTDLSSLNSLTGPLAARTVTSSDTSSVSATAATGTVSGSHTVVVNSLATTGSWYSDLETGPTAPLPATSFTLTTAANPSHPTVITIGSGVNNLNDVAAAINGTANLGVTATVVSDSTGSRLAIISTTPGKAADFSITSPPSTGTSWASQPLPTGETLGVNSFTITPNGGSATTITTTNNETYAQLASAINAVTPSLGVTASTTTGVNGTTLSIVSTNGTTPFTISEPNYATPNFGFTQSAAGADASVTVDGVPIDSATNTVTGAIPGVTLTLLGQTSIAGANLTVASDAGQVSTAINQFVTDYNTAIGLVNTQYAASSTGTEGVLSADPTVRALQNSLMQALNYVSTPPASTGTTWTSKLLPTSNTLGVGSFTITPNGGTAKTITTTPGETYTQLAAAINATTPSLGVTASTTTSAGGTTLSIVSSDGSTPFTLTEPNYATAIGTATTTVSTLNSLGITAGTDGTLTVDSATLNNALVNNPTDVQNFFAGTALNGFGNSMTTALSNFTNPGNGAFTVDLSSISASQATLTADISNLETNYIANQQTVLTAMYSAAEIALQQLPTEMAQIQAELGNNTKSGG
jgi:flagellar hook-associated protein 2